MFLDTVQSISSRALGYNMPEMHKLAKSDEMAHYLSNRTSLGLYPPKNWPNLLQRAYKNVAPKGFNYVTTTMCGSCAVEGAMKYAFMAHAARDRGG
jgi:4-aminobutyrate aminotransferase / (S)-3-amino-2-methylpropionate transaminase